LTGAAGLSIHPLPHIVITVVRPDAPIPILRFSISSFSLS
jgi:hypothetical protein